MTIVEIKTVLFDGETECEICGRPIAYRTKLGKVPTLCRSCVDESREPLKVEKAGDGYREIK